MVILMDFPYFLCIVYGLVSYNARPRPKQPQPPPQRPAAVVQLKGDEEFVEITTFESRKPKERTRAVRVEESGEVRDKAFRP